MVRTDPARELTRSGDASVSAAVDRGFGRSKMESCAGTKRPVGSTARTVRYALAGLEDEAAIRQLLRENPTPGAISVSFEREPDYFLGQSSGDQTIVAYENDRLACVGRCSVRPRYLNGELRRVGYLGELRLDARGQRKVEILRGGYAFFRELQEKHPADFYFTSIASDNERARRVFERGLPGLPRYSLLTEFVTLLIPVGRASDAALSAERAECATFLNRHAPRRQLAAPWSADELSACAECLVTRDNNERVTAMAVLWDQRAWRQTVVRGYAPPLALARPFVNLAATMLGGLRLPRIGSVLATGFLSPLASEPGHESELPRLIRTAFEPSQRRGIEILTIGLAANDARLDVVRRAFRCREYRTRLYRVTWAGDVDNLTALDGRTFLPEVALL
jgi:hypothetical protein